MAALQAGIYDPGAELLSRRGLCGCAFGSPPETWQMERASQSDETPRVSSFICTNEEWKGF